MITFTSAEAFWLNPQDNVPGVQPGDPAITNGVPTSSISWGGSFPQSGYDVTMTIPDPTQFPVAVFSHRNFTVPDPSLTSVQLDIVLDFLVDGVQTGPLTFTFTFTHEETPNNLNPCPYPTPPGEGCTDRVTFLDAPIPTTFTVGGKTYTLGLSFLDQFGNPVDEFITREGGTVNTADLDVDFALVPPELEVAKSGPATLTLAQSGDFTIDVRNTGPNDAWNATIVDRLPNPATGGMCDLTPQVLSAQVFAADGVTPVPGKGPLVAGADYTFAYAGAPTCELTLTMLSAASVVGPDERLIISYRTQLDADTQAGVTLTNVAGATQWFSDDAAVPGRETYTRSLTDGTVGVDDHEDAHDVSTDPFDFLYEKTVVDPVSGTPLTTAAPGDTLRYRLRFENRTPNALDGLGFADEIDRLNGSPLFEPNSLVLVTVPALADTTGTDPIAGVAGTGVVDVRNLSVAAGASVLVEFDVTLIAAIPDGTLATDQADLLSNGVPFGLSDDPGVNGPADPFVAADEDPTVVLIQAEPDFQVEKVSAYLDGDPTVLLAGERLRYTITIKNVGSENVTDAMLRDAVPTNTTYIAGSTTLNGAPVPDGPGGSSPLALGILLNAPEDPTPGAMRADPDPAANNVATIVFDVVVDPNVIDGTIISNQAFVSSPAENLFDQPSDDPSTATPDDPTQDVVGNVPLLFAPKSVQLVIDNDVPGQIDPGDRLQYTITVYNNGATPATGVILTDTVPTFTTYVDDSTTLNGAPVGVPDGGSSPLIAGLPIGSPDQPAPGPTGGTISPGASAVVTFLVDVVGTASSGDIIENWATVSTSELPDVRTDGDGDPGTGPEPTRVVVGDGQQLAITKAVSVVGGGPALASSTLEYLVRVTNIATVAATGVVLTDPVPVGLTYVPGSATMNGATTGVTFVDPLITADYAAAYGPLPPGAVITLRFQAVIDPLPDPLGTTITNTATVTWNVTESLDASVSLVVGGTPGVGVIGGRAWHDADFDDVFNGETTLEGWTVELLRNGTPIQTNLIDASGSYAFGAIPPNDVTGDQYAVRFSAPGADPNTTASLGTTTSPFTNGPQQITDIVLASGSLYSDLNLPIDPNGVVYGAVSRAPIAGAVVSLVDPGTGSPLPDTCFPAGSNQQDQVTLGSGHYKFDLVFGAGCPDGGAYLISVTVPSAGFTAGVSQVIPPQSDATTPAYPVAACPDDTVPATVDYCEIQPLPTLPTGPARTAATAYHLHLDLDSSLAAGSSQIFNNHIPLDPVLGAAVAITKTTPQQNVSRGQLVPYEIAFTNSLGSALLDLTIVDHFPAGFTYVEGSARVVDEGPLEPVRAGHTLTWTDVGVGAFEQKKIVLLLAVGAGVSEGEFTNRAQAISSITGFGYSGEAQATVRVVPDPTFDCTDVLGKVFDDANRNGVQDDGEDGLAGVRVATARGLVATTDPHGRFHITCAVVPREDRGSNFVLKLDDRTLPSGYRMTTRQTQVHRATRGKALRFQFGAAIHRVIGLDLADAVFEPDTTEMRMQWEPRIGLLLDELAKQPALLRLSYVADVEDAGLVERRMRLVKQRIEDEWEARGGAPLEIETEIFWRRGSPPARGGWGSMLPSVDAGPPALPSVDAGPPALPSVDAGPPGEAVERHLPIDEPFTQWSQDPSLYETEAGDRLEEREVVTQEANTVKLRGVVPPIYFASGVAEIPPSTIRELRKVLDGMVHLRNVRLHLVGHADDQALSPALARIYGDNEGLSRERAGEVAEFLQRGLALPPESISFSWAGDTDPLASNATEAGRARNRRVEVEVWYDEIEERTSVEDVVVAEDIKRIKVCRTETVCKLTFLNGHARRTRLKNLIPALRYGEEGVEIPDAFVRQVQEALHNLRDKQNVIVKFVAYTDDAPMPERVERVYGNHLALSKARARRASLAIQDALGLPTSAIDSDGRGADFPVATNETERGRALNRRIEVEFWHDDPLRELSDEPQLCPEDAGAEIVTKVYDPPWGRIAPLAVNGGQIEIPAGYAEDLRRAMSDVAGEANVRLRFIGYTANERLDRRTALVYGDDIGLSAARARRARDQVAELLGLREDQAEHEGHGYVHSKDVVNGGFLQGDQSEVEVQVVYDELAALDDYEGVEVTRMTRELRAKDPLALNLMRITVDGVPIDDPGRSLADIQRCTDVALEDTDIQFRFDNLDAEPRLSVTAVPIANGPQSGAPHAFRFRTYTNYGHFLDRSEVRLFEKGASVDSDPVAVAEVDGDGLAEWHPDAARFDAPVHEMIFVLRAYDAEGEFDETAPQTLWLSRGPDTAVVADLLAPETSGDPLLDGYGESGPLDRNIALGAVGTAQVHGRGVPPEHSVWVAGHPVPVDADGNFAAEVLLPTGMHTVEVAVLDEAGNGELFLRDLEFERSDWFYVGIADLTVQTDLSGDREDRLEGENSPIDPDATADGRLAFYVNGKFADGWSLRASADTREEPVEDLFSNFMDKSPDALFRRIDPDYHYPTFGDDGIVEEMAPTQGKFYARLQKDESYGQWGNFEVAYLDNELAQVDRGLYGANLHYQTQATTRFGEQRLVLDGFAADPGTVGGRDEFRGTGGSLYYLRRQDILTGSERLRIEVRDKVSGLVTAVVHLQPTVDYDIDYLQGRILLTEPMASTVADRLLVRSAGLSGNEAWLVAQYEYTPGIEELDAWAAGGQGSAWLTDWMKVGLTANRNEDEDTDADSELYAADVTLRATTDSWVKVQAGRSDGLVSTSLRSDDGGFLFQNTATPGFLMDAEADAYRADVSVGFADLLPILDGQLSVYAQTLEAGYTAPGQTALTDTDQIGGALDIPITARMALAAKADQRIEDDGLELGAQEVDLTYQLTEQWSLAAGVRNDTRQDDSPIVPLTQEEGDRTDAVVQVGFDAGSQWSTYAFGQGTLRTTDDRDDNHRGGVGGSYRLTDRLSLDGEVSHGNLGPAARVGTTFQQSEQTKRYVSYALDNELGYDGVHRRQGNLVSGVKHRMSDSSSVYLEDRYQHGDTGRGLARALGVDLAPSERWTLSANWELGTLIDSRTNAETDRRAGGVRVAYGFEDLHISSGVEYRFDDTEQTNGTWVDRTTWLFRNNLRYQVTPSGRFIAKLNHSMSDSSQGEFFDGGYTEGILGYAYRPVQHDRLHTLVKYTYFYNVPTTDQIGGNGSSAQFLQKSHVAAVDVTYDLTSAFSIGGKYAFRRSQVSLDRVDPDFFDNDAHLYIVRGDWRFRKNWEGTLEGRMLHLPDLDERRVGSLFTIYRYLGDNLKVGVGYNFTDFSEDLTDLSYDHHGLFFNLVGTL